MGIISTQDNGLKEQMLKLGQVKDVGTILHKSIEEVKMINGLIKATFIKDILMVNIVDKHVGLEMNKWNSMMVESKTKRRMGPVPIHMKFLSNKNMQIKIKKNN